MMVSPARAMAGLNHIVTKPFRLYRQRTIFQLVASHLAVVLITFVLLNVLAVAVIAGWLPGRDLVGLEEASQDFYLGERTRGHASWIDTEQIIAEYGSLDAPAAQAELDRLLTIIVANEVPGYNPPGAVDADRSIALGIPDAAVITDPTGVVIATSDPALGQIGDAAWEITGPAVSDAITASMRLEGGPDDWSGVAYSMRISGDVTGAAAPIFNSDGGVAGYLAFQGYPLPAIYSEMRTEILKETALAVVTTSWIYIIPAVLVALPFAWLQSRGTSRRLEKLAHLADAFADGDLHTRIRVATRDEIGRLAERFNEMGSRIETGDRERRAFLSNVSHELRTPVAIIQGTVERLQDRKCETPEEATQAIDLVNLETRNLTRLIDDLSTLGRLEEAKLRLDLQPVSVFGVADEAVSGLKTLAWTQRKVSLENIVSPDLPHAFGDASRLRQIIHNLLFNALRHTPEGGLIVVQAGLVGDEIEVCVSDTGVGIPPETLERIFDRYYQAELATRSHDGSGLGLHIVQQLVRAQGGKITVESEVGQGTTFHFTLPRASGNRTGPIGPLPPKGLRDQVV
jgi:signal transduction histidine kinase